jgi:SAM-dependent methyltransferase
MGFLSFIENAPQNLESFDHGYYPELYRIEESHFWFRYRNALILRALQKFLPGARKIMEIGCGTGFVLSEINRRIPGLSLSGSDLYSDGLQFAGRRIPNAVFYQIDACSIPFRDEFDVIMALDILEHIETDSKALGETYRALKTGGGLLLTVPQHKWLWSMHDRKAFHKRRYTWNELKRKMVSCGFHIVYHTSFISFLLPMMVASRFAADISSSIQKKYDPLQELKINRLFNVTAGIICRLEGLLLKKGFSMPLGGSLLCIGMK